MFTPLLSNNVQRSIIITYTSDQEITAQQTIAGTQRDTRAIANVGTLYNSIMYRNR